MKIISTVCLAIALFSFNTISFHTNKWTKLFNGKDLSGWDTYIGSGFDANGKKLSTDPIGLNNDPNKVFSVVTLNGEKVIRISGENFGALTSKNKYSSYHLQLKFKWGEKTWPPKIGKKKDSGLLYHCVGPDGADGGFWMRSQEFQVEEGNSGDYWGCAGGFEEIRATRMPDSNYRYDPSAEPVVFGQHTPAGRHCVKNGNAEKASGGWNTLDLYCRGDSSLHIVNGQIMMMLIKSQQWDNGQAKPLTEGKIQLQSEGAEVYYKDIKIESVKSLPL